MSAGKTCCVVAGMDEPQKLQSDWLLLLFLLSDWFGKSISALFFFFSFPYREFMSKAYRRKLRVLSQLINNRNQMYNFYPTDR